MDNAPLDCPKCSPEAAGPQSGIFEKTNWRIALAGNPNSGKTTVFNALTGSHQHTGNWPGKTVANKAGWFSHNGSEIEIVDLPGTYSLSAYSAEEIIARDYLLTENPDAVIITLDEANLERNLYLAVQVLELSIPAVIALNKADIAAGRGIKTDTDKLSRILGVPIVRTIASRKKGLDQLVATLLERLENEL